jgi:phenylpropionate dioxygenase-like ring-hydroxylating dioxygenase large terminal subunit
MYFVGANITKGGKIVDDNIQCPFHHWSMRSDGSIAKIPYIKDPTDCPTFRTLKTYPCVEYNGYIYFWFHAEGAEPTYNLPQFVTDELQKDGEKWVPYSKWDVGYRTCTPVDWVDQSGDHAHFFCIHKDFMVPYTLIEFPQWIKKLIPLGITHSLTTYRGDDSEWKRLFAEDKDKRGLIDPNFIFFKDRAGLTWNNEVIQSTMADTFEMYVGPSLIVFHIPFTIGAFKAFVSMTPVEGGCVMRVRTWVDKQTYESYFKSWIAWLLIGISVSNLANDLLIVENKIRLKKPLLQPFDGPYNRVNAWMSQFYSSGTESVGKIYANDW